ncbi:hypothetical protein EST38_g6352 [Candolleomyces aberdarensis]|uniref:Uncharacterized protein n=1 Tax=Candolleomyces aberdarensis TaxID=2316362 RepID=A0A4Q2DL61_9AGAR|nr:hypothetical protein EST38_g6352 [Candolleomyces aberdarensis]
MLTEHWLNSYIAMCSQQESPVPYIGNVNETEVQQFKDPGCLRMVAKGSGRSPDDVDEIVYPVRVHHLRSQEALMSSSGAERDEEIRMLRQFVKIIGAGCPAYDEIQQKVQEVYASFQNGNHQGAMKTMDWNQYDGQYAVDSHTRYFTERRHAPSLGHQPFPMDVDPDHVLEELRGTKYIRCEENVVQYLRKVNCLEAGSKYVRISPGLFKEGDIVEIWAAFVAYPAGKNEFKLVLAMRSLVLLTEQFREEGEERREVARRARAEIIATARAGSRPVLPTSRSLKRRYMEVAIEEEDTADDIVRKK